MQDKAKGSQIRARAEWVEKGERSTSYFLRLENIRQNSAHITALKDELGDIVINDKEILSTASYFTENVIPHVEENLIILKDT